MVSQINNERNTFKRENRFFRTIINKLQANDSNQYYSIEKEEIYQKFRNSSNNDSDDNNNNEQHFTTRMTAAIGAASVEMIDDELTVLSGGLGNESFSNGLGGAVGITNELSSSSSGEFKFKHKFSFNISNTYLPRHQTSSSSPTTLVTPRNNSTTEIEDQNFVVTPRPGLTDILVENDECCGFRRDLGFQCCPNTIQSSTSQAFLTSLMAQEKKGLEKVVGQDDQIYHKWSQQGNDKLLTIKSSGSLSSDTSIENEKHLTVKKKVDTNDSYGIIEKKSTLTTTTLQMPLQPTPHQQQSEQQLLKKVERTTEIVGDYLHNDQNVNHCQVLDNDLMDLEHLSLHYTNSDASLLETNKTLDKIVNHDCNNTIRSPTVTDYDYAKKTFRNGGETILENGKIEEKPPVNVLITVSSNYIDLFILSM